jgi:hypothetical protein
MTSWLTRYEARWDVAAATTDLTFAPAPTQAPLNFKALQARYDRQFNSDSTGLFAVLIVLIGLSLLVAASPFLLVGAVLVVVLVVVLRSRRPRSRPP